MLPPKVGLSERLNTIAALFVILPARLPVVPPQSICKTPAEIVVPPVIVLLPVRVRVPAPILTRATLFVAPSASVPP